MLTRARAVGWRCYPDVTIVRDKTGDGVRVTSRTGSAQRFVENWKKESWKLDAERRGSTFGAHRREANLRPMGAVQDGGQMNKTVIRLVEKSCLYRGDWYRVLKCRCPEYCSVICEHSKCYNYNENYNAMATRMWHSEWSDGFYTPEYNQKLRQVDGRPEDIGILSVYPIVISVFKLRKSY